MSTIDHVARKQTIVLTGGGTGGHITPILAVAHELKLIDASIETVYIGEKGGKFGELTDSNPDIDRSFSVRAGKFRRYHGESWLKRLFDVKTNVLNLRDVFYLAIGTVQAWWKLGRIKPSVVFLKGGFVGVPVGLAAAARGIPIVTHDSDAIPGLANRLVGRWARVHATALPAENYTYQASKVAHVGVLVEHSYEPVTAEKKQAYRQQIGLPPSGKVLLITGGSSGAQRVNDAVCEIAPKLLETFSDLNIVHQVGKGNQAVYGDFAHERLKVLEFLQPMYRYMGSADVVVARASANTIAELAVQGKAAIIVPSPYLAGGHQLENAIRIKEQGVMEVVQESEMRDSSQGLLVKVTELLQDDQLRERLAQRLHEQAIPDAAHRLAKVILDQVSS